MKLKDNHYSSLSLITAIILLCVCVCVCLSNILLVKLKFSVIILCHSSVNYHIIHYHSSSFFNHSLTERKTVNMLDLLHTCELTQIRKVFNSAAMNLQILRKYTNQFITQNS